MAHHRPFIVVAGNIGVGKSLVVERLSDELGLEPYYENDASNPYLTDFYEDMERWAFHSQLYFLKEGLKEHRRILARGLGAIQDRSVYEHFMVFAHDLHAQGLMSANDFTLLSELYYAIGDLLVAPDLLVYLDFPIDQLPAHIKKRNRQSAHTIDPTYLSRLHERYRHFLDSWISSPIIRLEMQHYALDKTEDFDVIAEAVLQGLRPRS
jgi:deoxyadenosine/deoxycytidine kinase